MKLLNISIFTALIFCFSCDKEEEKVEINPCANGVKDNGETAVDCGGTCSPCSQYAYLILTSNGDSKQATSKSIELEDGVYVLKAAYDTVLFQLNIGADLSSGTYAISVLKSGATMKTTPYTFVQGSISIGLNDTVEKKVGGNFDAKFANGFDTLRITGGQFEYIAY